MPATMDIVKLQDHLQRSGATWSIPHGVSANTVIPQRRLGAVAPPTARKAGDVPKLQLERVLNYIPRNPFLVERRIANKILPASAAIARPRSDSGPAPCPAFPRSTDHSGHQANPSIGCAKPSSSRATPRRWAPMRRSRPKSPESSRSCNPSRQRRTRRARNSPMPKRF